MALTTKLLGDSKVGIKSLAINKSNRWGEKETIKYLDVIYKLFVNLVKVSFKVGVCGDMSTRVGEEEVGHV